MATDGVSEHVPSQIAVPPEDGAAGGALVWLEVGVGQKMRLQVTPLVETPAAGRALVG